MACRIWKYGLKPKERHRYLPPEIWTQNILPRLPVKSALVCRSVCRSWCVAIDDPNFVVQHFKLSKKNCDKNLLIAVEKLGLQGSDGCRLTIRRGDTLRKCVDLYKANGRYHFSIRCNGLLFVHDYVNDDLNVWNPSIRKSLTIPPCPLVTAHSNVKYLFGFKSSSNDYLAYAFRGDHEDGSMMLTSVAVYTMSDNIWRIRDDKMNLPSWLFNSFKRAMCDENSVFIGGVIHWLQHDHYYEDEFAEDCLVSFDLDTERFNFLDVPDSHPIMIFSTFRFLFIFGEKLAIFCVSYKNVMIWILEEKLWHLRYTGPDNTYGFKYIWDHPNMVANFIRLKDDDITFVYGKIAFNFRTNEIQPVTRSVTPRLMLDTYFESMVLHRGCIGQILTSF